MSIVTKTTVRRATAVLAPPQAVSALITYARSVVTRITGNALFPVPVRRSRRSRRQPTSSRPPRRPRWRGRRAPSPARNEKKAVLLGLLKQLRAYIQGIADAAATDGPAIIESAGIAVRKTTTRTARVFSARPGAVSGVAKLVAASAGPRVSYEWSYSIDGGKTWVEAPATMQAKTQIAGLTLAMTVQFRIHGDPEGGARGLEPTGAAAHLVSGAEGDAQRSRVRRSPKEVGPRARRARGVLSTLRRVEVNLAGEHAAADLGERDVQDAVRVGDRAAARPGTR